MRPQGRAESPEHLRGAQEAMPGMLIKCRDDKSINVSGHKRSLVVFGIGRPNVRLDACPDPSDDPDALRLH
jgi:hypothetical protein